MDELDNLTDELRNKLKAERLNLEAEDLRLYHLIEKTISTKGKLISILIQTREKIASLSKLKEQHPNSKDIDTRIAENDKALKEGLELLESIENNLITYRKQQKKIKCYFNTADNIFKDLDEALAEERTATVTP